MNKIKPSLAKGTRDFGPEEMEIREYVINIFKNIFDLYGFRSIQTPSIENVDTITGNYGDEGDKLIFRILNSSKIKNFILFVIISYQRNTRWPSFFIETVRYRYRWVTC